MSERDARGMCTSPGGAWSGAGAGAGAGAGGKEQAAAAHLDHYRMQLYNYAVAERLRLAYPPLPPCYAPYGPRLALSMSLLQHRALQPEEPKPQHSYIGLIAMAILSSADRKLVLSDIYQHILDNYPYFRSRGPGWRNSIRHNLSLNDCFVKAGRSANGKGHYWAIHPANLEDFRKGDFRRRKAQRKVRKHMGLAVEEDGDESQSPPPQSPPPPLVSLAPACWRATELPAGATGGGTRKRQFDVASLLAPDEQPACPRRRDHSSGEDEPDVDVEDIDVVASDADERDGRECVASPQAQYPLWGGLGGLGGLGALGLGLGLEPALLGRYYEQLRRPVRAPASPPRPPPPLGT